MGPLLPAFAVLVGLSVGARAAGVTDVGAPVPPTAGALVESPGEAELGASLERYYASMGLERVPNGRLSAVWQRLKPVFSRSFPRVRIEVAAYDRPEPDVVSMPGRVFVSTGLVQALTDDELAAIVSHEAVHVIDSSRLKARQQLNDAGVVPAGAFDGASDAAAWFRGHATELPVQLWLEQTALYFGAEMAADAGFSPEAMGSAASKLGRSPGVELEDYLALHGADGPIWSLLTPQLDESALPDGGTPDSSPGPKSPDLAVSLPQRSPAWTFSQWRLTWPSAGASATVSAHASPLPDSSGTRGLATGSGGFLYSPAADQYWTIFSPDGTAIRRLDDRDSLFVEYADLALSPDGARASITTQEDVLVYDVGVHTSRWMGLGNVSAFSPDSRSIAYSDASLLFIKDPATGTLLHRISPGLQGAASSLVWAPDSHAIALGDSEVPDALLVTDTTSRDVARVALVGPQVLPPQWGAQGLVTVCRGAAGSLVVSGAKPDPSSPMQYSAAWTSAVDLPDGFAPTAAAWGEAPDGTGYYAIAGVAGSACALEVVKCSGGHAVAQGFPLSPAAPGAIGDITWLEPGLTLLVSSTAKATSGGGGD